jgi:hypothetical protein
MKQLLIYCLLLISLAANAQDEGNKINLWKSKKIKTENGLKGIKNGKDWTVPPKYHKLEAYQWNYLLCFKGELLDVYSNGVENTLLIEDLPLSKLGTYLPFANNSNSLTWKNGKWGFKNSILTVPEKFDSVFTICLEYYGSKPSKPDCGQYIGVKIDGKIGVYDNINKEIVAPGNYTGFTYTFYSKEISGHNFLLAAMKPNGELDYYDPYQKGVLPDFQKTLNAGLNETKQWENFWTGLKVFRSANDGIGLITSEGKIFLPPAAELIEFQGYTFTCSGGKLKASNYNAAPAELADTVLLTSVKTGMFLSGWINISYLGKGLDPEFKQNVKWDYDYKQPVIEERHCLYCEEGVVRYSTTSVVGTKVIQEAQTYTSKYKTTEDIHGNYAIVTEKYTIPPKVQNILKTEEKTAVCSFCKGYVDYSKIYRWDEATHLFVGYFKYQK